MANYILVMDQGTTGSRGVVYDEKGKTVAIDYEEYEQFFPNSGWWEQSGKTVWEVTLRTSRNAIKKAGLTGKDIAAIGIANQRETTTIWDKATGEPIYNTIVWGCRRTADICAKLIEEGYNDTVNKKTGLVIDPTYSGSKIRWILDEVEGAQERAEKGELLFGTIDCWLLYKLTKGKVHATDYSNAARSMVMNAHELKWDDELLSMLNIPKCMLPEIKPSVGIFGYTDPEWFDAEIPITGIAGDQSAALFGQACFEEGAAKNTYGTSAVLLMYTGDVAPETEKGLLTVAWGKDGKVKYSMGASILIAGQVIQWLRDKINLVDHAAKTSVMAESIPDNGGIFFVPAFTGLGAPHWNTGARGMIIGITAATSKEQITRAALESMAYQTRDLLEEMERNSGIKLKELKVDGGASKNDFLMQFQADIIDAPVHRPQCVETTAMGAAYLAGLAVGYWNSKEDVIAKFKEATVKGSQFKQPLLEFSGACAGCGETPYAKLITQLFGDRMYIANATGCSSIWGNSSPSTPYTVTPEGKGPAWSNSLFEDNAEFGYGMLLAQNTIRDRLKAKVEKIAEKTTDEAVKAAAAEYLETYTVGATNGTATDKLVAALEALDCDCEERAEVLKNKDFLAKKSQWIFGGDGWAYDIGYGGVDHVLASKKDINIMVFDTEVYSNTGGQSSKATKTGATAQFAAGGKETKKKDLAGMTMTYGYVYVAQIAMGADFNQTVKAIAEAEAYPGPSLIIAYAPCINHGIKKGMSKAQTEEQLAVECGYWNNFRYNPAAEGDKFSLDSKAPKAEGYQDFLNGEVRYNALKRANPAKADKLFALNEQEAMERYDYLNKLVTVYAAEKEDK